MVDLFKSIAVKHTPMYVIHSLQEVAQLADTLVILAHITRKSALLLGLHIGMAVYVQIKGTSILN